MTETARLGDLMASSKRSLDPRRFPDKVFELYSIPAFDAGAPVPTPGYEIGSPKQLVEPGDVLLSRIVPHIRRAWVVPSEAGLHAIGSSEWIIFRSDRFHPPYLRQVLVSDRFHVAYMATVAGVGGSLLRARPAHVSSIAIPLPPIEEQRRIAAALDQADELRAKRQASLALLDSLIESMLSDIVRDTSGLGSLLGGIGEIQGGLQVTHARARNPIDVPYLRVANVHRGRLVLDEIKKIRVTSSELERTRLFPDDILVVEGHGNAAEIGRVARWTGGLDPCVHQNHLIRVRVNRERASAAFIEAFLNSATGRQSLLRAARTTSGLNTISVKDVKAARVVLPPLEIQTQFADCVAGIGRVAATQRNHLAEVDSLFASLQHRAFSGQL